MQSRTSFIKKARVLPALEGFVLSSGVAMGGQVSFGKGDKSFLRFTVQNQTTELACK
jgi:hypothetical protein